MFLIKKKQFKTDHLKLRDSHDRKFRLKIKITNSTKLNLSTKLDQNIKNRRPSGNL